MPWLRFSDSGISNGQSIGAGNTGIAGSGVSFGSLTSHPGGAFTTNGQIIENLKFDQSDTIWLQGTNQIVRNCVIMINGADNYNGIRVDGSGALIENVLIIPGAGTSYKWGINFNSGTGLTVRSVDISNCENGVTLIGTGCTLERSYLHNMVPYSNLGGTPNCIELYAGSNHIIKLNRIGDGVAGVQSTIVVAPQGSNSSAGVDIFDNFIDGGLSHLLIDNQSSGTLTNVRVLRNKMGGHTATGVYGRYVPVINSDGRAITENDAAQASDTASIQWPSSGVNVNTWAECSDLSPDKTGQTILAA